MGPIVGEAQADRERNRDCFTHLTSKRTETRSVELMETRERKRTRNRYCDQTGRVRALRFCHVDPGELFKLGVRSVTGMLHKQRKPSADESVVPTSRPRCTRFTSRWNRQRIVWNSWMTIATKISMGGF
jgi:hypothetical protein